MRNETRTEWGYIFLVCKNSKLYSTSLIFKSINQVRHGNQETTFNVTFCYKEENEEQEHNDASDVKIGNVLLQGWKKELMIYNDGYYRAVLSVQNISITKP